MIRPAMRLIVNCGGSWRDPHNNGDGFGHDSDPTPYRDNRFGLRLVRRAP